MCISFNLIIIRVSKNATTGTQAASSTLPSFQAAHRSFLRRSPLHLETLPRQADSIILKDNFTAHQAHDNHITLPSMARASYVSSSQHGAQFSRSYPFE
jgi:hypothetical protein